MFMAESLPGLMLSPKLISRGGAPYNGADIHCPGVGVDRKEDPITTHAAAPPMASAFQPDNVAGERSAGHRLDGSADLHPIFSGKLCDCLLGRPCDGDCPGHWQIRLMIRIHHGPTLLRLAE